MFSRAQAKFLTGDGRLVSQYCIIGKDALASSLWEIHQLSQFIPFSLFDVIQIFAPFIAMCLGKETYEVPALTKPHIN